MLNRDTILKADDLPRELVEVPEWGGSCYVRTLRGNERDSFEQSLVGKKQKMSLENVRARFAVLTVCDDSGTRLFTDADAKALGDKSAAALDRVFAVAQRLNGFSQDAVEDLAKN